MSTFQLIDKHQELDQEKMGVIESFTQAIEGLFVRSNINPILEDITIWLTKLFISGPEIKEDPPYVIKMVQKMMLTYGHSFDIKRWFPYLPSLSRK